MCKFFLKSYFYYGLTKTIQRKGASLSKISKNETIDRVKKLIDSGEGDVGRLYHILEFLKNNRKLYHSDQKYLEGKIDSQFSIDEETSDAVSDRPILSQIQNLIENGQGDPGRLQHIYDMLSNDKPLYLSDQLYLESKLGAPQRAAPRIESKVESIPTETITEPPDIRGSLPKGWTPQSLKDDAIKQGDVSLSIKEEEEEIEKQKRIANELSVQREKLTQLIMHRKQYEQHVSEEKSSLESQIKEERSRIENQTRLSQEIIAQKQELDKVKKERTAIIQSIDSEKNKTTEELLAQKKQLAQAQLEQEKIDEQLKKEQSLLGLKLFLNLFLL